MQDIDRTKIKGEYLNGAYSELAGIIGIDAVLKIYSKYRGTSIFLPVELFSREFILGQIIDEYNRTQHKAACHKIRLHRKVDKKNS